MRGKTLGIVGYGHAGSQLGVMAESLSLRVLFYDTVSLMPIGRAEPASFDSLLAESDFICLTISTTVENDLLFTAKEFGKMKKGAHFINVSHAGAIDEDALAESLRSGHLAGAALDVLPSYASNPLKSPLLSLPNVIFTPNIGSI